jgi:hypothetical protein
MAKIAKTQKQMNIDTITFSTKPTHHKVAGPMAIELPWEFSPEFKRIYGESSDANFTKNHFSLNNLHNVTQTGTLALITWSLPFRTVQKTITAVLWNITLK